MKNDKRILWITRTALFIALLVAWQLVSRGFGQFVTGSGVNLILILAVMTGGFATGATVAVVSQLAATMLSIIPGGQLLFIPFVCLGNLAIVTIWHFIGNIKHINGHAARIIATAAGAAGKFAVLYIGIVRIIAPIVLEIPETAPIYAMMSYPQLITAGIGGALACIVLPVLGKALKKKPEVEEND